MSARHTVEKETYSLTLDRDLPIPVGVQLRGQIEYGVATGEITRGSRLPSVRELARGLNIAPATVSAVYKELQEGGLLESQPGRGTFVPAGLAPAPESAAILALRRIVDELFKQAEALDFTPREVAEAVSLWAGQKRIERRLHSLFVGIFPKATDAYVATLRDSLRRGDTLAGTTFEAFKNGLLRPDLYITFANRERALRDLVGESVPIVSVTFIPSEATRTHLAAIAPETRLAVVVGVPEFLPTLREHVARYAPQMASVRAVTLASSDLPQTLKWCSALVYATGAEEVLNHLPHPTDAFEFRYEPEPRSIQQALLPSLEALRRQRVETPENAFAKENA